MGPLGLWDTGADHVVICSDMLSIDMSETEALRCYVSITYWPPERLLIFYEARRR
jgi:hypothetical protein